MKKLLAMILAATMVLSVSVTAFAAETKTFDSGETGTGNPPYTASKDVEVNVTPHNPATVYYVVVEWDDLTFEYDFDGAPTWLPESHTYDPVNTAYWDKTLAEIKVTNHSNAAVDTIAAFKNNLTSTSLYNVTGTLNNAKLTLATGEGLTWNTAASGTSVLNISGTPNVTGEFTLDTIKVTISPAP